MECTYLKTLTLERLKKEFGQGLSSVKMPEIEMNLSDIKESCRYPGHPTPIMGEMERWFHEQMDRILRNERRWIEQIRGNVLVDDEAMENLHHIGIGVRKKLDDLVMQMHYREEQLEEAKRKFVDTELRLILFRRRLEEEAYKEYIMQIEAWYNEKLEFCMYERLAAMLSNIRPLLEW